MLTQDKLKELLTYDPDTGIFKWIKKSANRIRVGEEAGILYPYKNGKTHYRNICISYKGYRAHRLAWLYMTGSFPEYEIDHINHNASDNRWCNLREVTKAENQRNRSLYMTNTSGFPGVYWSKLRSKWMASIRYQGKSIYLGYFKNILDAVHARKEAEKLYGFHPNHCVNIK